MARLKDAFGGIDVDEASHVTAKFPLGFAVEDDIGTVYTYVKAGEALAVEDAVKGVVGANPNNGVLKTTARTTPFKGVCHVVIASGEHGFIITKCPTGTRVKTSDGSTVALGCKILTATGTPGLLLQPSATGATLDDAVATDMTGKAVVLLVDDGDDTGQIAILS